MENNKISEYLNTTVFGDDADVIGEALLGLGMYFDDLVQNTKINTADFWKSYFNIGAFSGLASETKINGASMLSTEEIRKLYMKITQKFIDKNIDFTNFRYVSDMAKLILSMPINKEVEASNPLLLFALGMNLKKDYLKFLDDNTNKEYTINEIRDILKKELKKDVSKQRIHQLVQERLNDDEYKIIEPKLMIITFSGKEKILNYYRNKSAN